MPRKHNRKDYTKTTKEATASIAKKLSKELGIPNPNPQKYWKELLKKNRD